MRRIGLLTVGILAMVISSGSLGLGSANYLESSEPRIEIVWETSYGKTLWPSGIVRSLDGGYVLAGGRWFRTGSAMVYDSIYVLKVDEDGEKVWEKTYGKFGNDRAWTGGLVQSGDGGYLVAGSTRSLYTGKWSIYLLKIDDRGEKVWERNYEDEEEYYDSSGARDITKTEDGGFIVVGASTLLRIDSNGEKIWEKAYGGESRSIARCADGKFVVLIERQGTHLVKIDRDGNMIWERKYGALRDPWHIVHCREGGFVAVGGTYHNTAYVSRLDENGSLIWGETYRGSAYAITQTKDGGFMVTGGTRGTASGDGIHLTMIDSDGVRLWDWTENRTQSIGLPGYVDFVAAIIQCPEEGFVLGGGLSIFRIKIISERGVLKAILVIYLLTVFFPIRHVVEKEIGRGGG